jgi:endonuclease YncB( thermonuclease family)
MYRVDAMTPGFLFLYYVKCAIVVTASDTGFDNEPYLKTEAEARKAKLNRWSLGDKYMSPKEWRKMHK